MKTVGIIAEYNPFHKGHLYHLEQTRRLLKPDLLVVIVSSYFSQRGLPSLLTPEDKARMALEAGADLVLELPAVYAAQSADYFALYAIESLKMAGVNTICFGSETNDLDYLKSLADRREDTRKDPSLSFARSFSIQYGHLQSNDILGIQYIRCCKMFGIEPYCIKRNSSFKSATATRQDYFDGLLDTSIPDQYLQEHFQKEQSWNSYYPLLRMMLLLTSLEDLRSFFLVEEGIESRLQKAARNNTDWQGFLQDAISKTYTRARIQRTCLFILLQVKKREMKDHASFFALIPVGMNEKGASWLKGLPVGTPIYSRSRDLPDFLKETMGKTRILYESVMDHPLFQRLPIIYKEPNSSFKSERSELSE